MSCNRRERTVLLIAYIYPPSRYFEIAAQRPANFAKHLLDHGWSTVVLTRHWDERSQTDHLISPVHPNSWDMKDAVDSACQSLRSSGHATLRVPFCVSKTERCWRRIDNHIRSSPAGKPFVLLRKGLSLLKYLDRTNTYTDWPERAYRAAVALNEKVAFDAIVATSAPPGTLWLGQRLSRRLGVPWIADLRDRWEEFYPRPYVARFWLPGARKILQTAKCVVHVSDELSELEGDLLGCYMVTIPNGFNSDDFPKFDSHLDGKDKGKFEIVYTGTIYPERREPDVFLAGLRLLLTESPDLSSTIRFRYMGRCAPYLQACAVRHQVDHVLINDGHVDRDTAIQRQSQADILLQLTDCKQTPGIATGKIYEYFGARRPIMAVPGDGSTVDRLIRETNTGVICRNAEDVKSALTAYYSEWNNDGYVAFEPNEIAVERYSRRTQAKALAELLDDCCKGETTLAERRLINGASQ